jgi:hypothetical protein
MLARVHPPGLTPQPLAVHETCRDPEGDFALEVRNYRTKKASRRDRRRLRKTREVIPLDPRLRLALLSGWELSGR